VDGRASTIGIALRAGDQQVGYFDLDIHYLGVHVDSVDTAALAAAARDPDVEALYDEVDVVATNTFAHRWLWWPYQDVDILFDQFDFCVQPQPDRSFTRGTDPYVEIRAPVG
jgi:hypothetical protein